MSVVFVLQSQTVPKCQFDIYFQYIFRIIHSEKYIQTPPNELLYLPHWPFTNEEFGWWYKYIVQLPYGPNNSCAIMLINWDKCSGEIINIKSALCDLAWFQHGGMAVRQNITNHDKMFGEGLRIW